MLAIYICDQFCAASGTFRCFDLLQTYTRSLTLRYEARASITFQGQVSQYLMFALPRSRALQRVICRMAPLDVL